MPGTPARDGAAMKVRVRVTGVWVRVDRGVGKGDRGLGYGARRVG